MKTNVKTQRKEMFSRQCRKLSKLSTEVEILNRPINRSCCCFFNENSAIKILQDTMCTHAQLLQSCPALCNSMDCTPPGSSVHGESPGKNTEVDCHSLFQGIFPTQGWNLGLLHCRRSFYQLSHQGSPLQVSVRPIVDIQRFLFCLFGEFVFSSYLICFLL